MSQFALQPWQLKLLVVVKSRIIPLGYYLCFILNVHIARMNRLEFKFCTNTRFKWKFESALEIGFVLLSLKAVIRTASSVSLYNI